MFKLLLGDITKFKCDAIVNSANTSLLGGCGVDGAIHKACGKKLLEECRDLQGCLTGHAKITQSYDLTTNDVYWIIHTVGPIFRNNGFEGKYLRKAYNSALTIASNYSKIYRKQALDNLSNHMYKFINGFMGDMQKENLIKDIDLYIQSHPIKTIAFPSISTGAYFYPLKEACTIALNEILSFIEQFPDSFDEVYMICEDQKTYDMFNSLYKAKVNV